MKEKRSVGDGMRVWAVVSGIVGILCYVADYFKQENTLNSPEFESLQWRLSGNVFSAVYEALSEFPYDEKFDAGFTPPIVSLSILFTGGANAGIVYAWIGIDARNDVPFRIE